MDSDSDSKSAELRKTELITIAQSILYASEYSNGKSDMLNHPVTYSGIPFSSHFQ
jgi:hypothetical protein